MLKIKKKQLEEARLGRRKSLQTLYYRVVMALLSRRYGIPIFQITVEALLRHDRPLPPKWRRNPEFCQRGTTLIIGGNLNTFTTKEKTGCLVAQLFSTPSFIFMSTFWLFIGLSILCYVLWSIWVITNKKGFQMTFEILLPLTSLTTWKWGQTWRLICPTSGLDSHAVHQPQVIRHR